MWWEFLLRALLSSIKAFVASDMFKRHERAPTVRVQHWEPPSWWPDDPGACLFFLVLMVLLPYVATGSKALTY